MKILVSVMLIVAVLTGCTDQEYAARTVLDLRQKVLTAESCTFVARIIADYEDEIYEFQMKCTSDNTGAISFEVMEPASISGITGYLSGDGGSLTFDDKILAFPMLTQLRLTPVSAPWIFLNTLRSGYISGYSDENDDIVVYIDDSFEEHPLQLQIDINDEGIPYLAEIIWMERRILTLEFLNFEIL